MKVPRPRLRQVFEHTTTFRVQKPGAAKPITIAKSALSPNMVTKLRKFARGGVPTQEEADAAAKAADVDLLNSEESVTTPAESLAPAAAPMPAAPSLVEPSAPVPDVASEPAFTMKVSEEVAAEEARAKNEAIASAASEFAEAAVTDPKQVGKAQTKYIEKLNELGLSQEEKKRSIQEGQALYKLARDTAAKEAMPPYLRLMAEHREEFAKDEKDRDPKKLKSLEQKMASMREAAKAKAPAPVAPVAVAAPAAAAAPAVAAPAAPSPVAAAPVAAPVAAAPAVEPVAAPAAPAVAPVVVTPPAPVAPPAAIAAPAAPVPAPTAPLAAAPAAPVAVAPVPAPAAPPKIEIKIPEGVTDVSAESFKKALEANPTADQAEVATALVRKVRPDIPPPDFKTLGERPEPAEGETALERFDAAVAKKSEALTAEAEADFKTRQDLAAIAQQAEARQLMAIKKNEDVAKNLASRREQLKDAYEKSEQETSRSFFSRLDTGQKIGSVIALAVGGFLSGSTGTPNYVYTAFNNAMDRDLENQKRRRDSILKQYERVLGDEEDAQKLARADLLNLTSLQIDAVKARSNLRAVAPQLQKLQADLDMEAVKLREDVRKKMYDADIAKANAESQEEYRDALTEAAKRRGMGIGRNAGIMGQNLEFRKARWESGRTFSVPDPADPAKSIFIKAPNETTARQNIQTITQRIEGTMALEDFEKWLALHKDENFSPTTIQEMRLKIANVVEKYPGTQTGSKALVTVAQKNIITPAIESTNLPIIRYLDTLGLTSTAIKDLKKDAIRGVKIAVQGAAEQNDPGAAEFFNKWSEQGYRGRTGIPARPRATAVQQPAAGVAPTPTPTSTVYTVMSNKDKTSFPTTDKAQADRFRKDPNYTVTP
jgi:hypothetical protein